jgi:aspartate aminotransferase
VIPEGIVHLMEPQERFDARQARAARLGPRLVDLSYANFDGPLDPRVRKVLEQALATDRSLAFQYTPFGGSRTARRAVADALTASHGQSFDWRDVILTSGAAAALTVVLQAVGRPDAEVLVPVPCWLDHPLYVAASGMCPVLVPLASRHAFDLDVDALDAAITPRTTAVVLGNPANPTGRSYDAATLAQLAEVLGQAEQRLGRPVTLLADETHRDLGGPRFSPAATHHDRTLIVYSFGKYHALQGQRLGYVAVAPAHPEREALRAELVRWARIAGNATPTSLMQLAVPGLLALRHDTVQLDRWRERYVAGLATAGYELVPPDGTHFVYVRTPPALSDDEWAETLLRDHRTLVLPAEVFHHTGWFRLSLTATAASLEAGLAALESAAGRWCRASA